MNASELKNTLKIMMKHKLPALIKGAPGVGKSDVVSQVASELKMDLIISHPVVSDPTDPKGLPGIVDGEAEFLPFGDLRKAMNAKKPTIWFFDDLGQAPAVVQAAYMQLFLARQCNGHKISDHIVFIAATNRREDRAGVTGILEPVKSRFVSILALEPDETSWIKWAIENEMPAELIGFIHFRPAMLNSELRTADIVNHSCPRTLAHAGKLMKAGLTSTEVLAGAIGEGAAAELVGFLNVYRQLPSVSQVLLSPKKAIVPTEPAALYAITSALVEKTTKDNFPRVYEYVSRLQTEYNVLFVRDAAEKTPDIQTTTTFIKWSEENKEVLL